MRKKRTDREMQSIIDFKHQHRFEELSRELQATDDARRLDRPLHYWALANDRRLPRALLGHVTREIVKTPYDDLRATPGIGRKKIATLLELLERATKDASHDHELGFSSHKHRGANGDSQRNGRHASLRLTDAEEFDPDAVSERTWEQWREAVKLHGLEGQPLGRFALSLQDLPRVAWRTPLAEYTDLTLEQIRGKRTHGVKRVRSIIEVFWALQSLLGDRPTAHLTVRVVPRFAAPLEAWLAEAAQRDDFPGYEEVRSEFVKPLMTQLRRDAGPLVAQLVTRRLRVERQSSTVRAAAERLGLTRARVYQLLAEPIEMFRLRWPEGRDQLEPLIRKAQLFPENRGAILFSATAEMLFPAEADRME